jgi:DUF1680 family protein
VYAQKDNNVFVNLFVSSNTTLKINNKPLQIIQQNNYPWDGDLTFKIIPASPVSFNLLVRIPGWAQNQAMPSDLYRFVKDSDKKAVIKINGQSVDYIQQNGYALLNRKWKKGDVVEVNLPMDVRQVSANENIKDDIGKVALQRGPIIYCAEWPDNFGKTSNIIVPENTIFTTMYKPDLLDGITILTSEVQAVVIKNESSISTEKQAFTAIPYYAWAHRGKGEMMIWFPTKVKNIDLLSKQ